MKIMVYYLAVNYSGWSSDDIDNAVQNKITELQDKFPYFKTQIMVIPQYGSSDDRVEVLDMTPTYNNPNPFYIPPVGGGVTGTPTAFPNNPYVVTTSGAGSGVGLAGSGVGTPGSIGVVG